MNEDLLIYCLFAIFVTGAVVWLLAALALLLGFFRGMAAVVHAVVPHGKHGPSAEDARRAAAAVDAGLDTLMLRLGPPPTAEGRCPVCHGSVETCRCGDNPGNPRRAHHGGAL